MTKAKKWQLGFSLFVALLAAITTFFVYSLRDSIFTWEWQEPVGKFETQLDKEAFEKVMLWVEQNKHQPHYRCLARWIGKDDRYVYMAAGCAHFEEKLGELSLQGSGGFYPLRVRFLFGKVWSVEKPDFEPFENSLRRIFPKQAAEIFRNQHTPAEFRREGKAFASAPSSSR